MGHHACGRKRTTGTCSSVTARRVTRLPNLAFKEDPPVVDMGAYEVQPPPCLDITGDNLIGIQDFLLLLSLWGTNPGGAPDFDGDGVVAVPDLLILLGAWGACN